MSKEEKITITPEMAESIVVMGDNILDLSEIEGLRLSLAEDDSDQNLARIMALVNNQPGELDHLVDDPDNTAEETERYLKESDIWWDFYVELTDEVKLRLETSNFQKSTDYETEDVGLYYLVKPFMEQNGYTDGKGWWIQNG